MRFAEAQQAVETIVYFIDNRLAAGTSYDEAVHAASYRFHLSEMTIETVYDDFGGENKKGKPGETGMVSCVAEQASS